MVVLPSSVRPDLTPEDKEVKRRLGKCRPRAHSELIKSDLPDSSGVSPSSSPRSKSPPLPATETSLVKPTRGELRARVEVFGEEEEEREAQGSGSS